MGTINNYEQACTLLLIDICEKYRNENFQYKGKVTRGFIGLTFLVPSSKSSAIDICTARRMQRMRVRY